LEEVGPVSGSEQGQRALDSPPRDQSARDALHQQEFAVTANETARRTATDIGALSAVLVATASGHPRIDIDALVTGS
jgi:hypothetical protein